MILVTAPSGSGKTELSNRTRLAYDLESDKYVTNVYNALISKHGPKWWDKASKSDWDVLYHAHRLAWDNALISKAAIALTAQTGFVELALREGLVTPREVVVWVPSATTLSTRQAQRADPNLTFNVNDLAEEYLSFAKAHSLFLVRSDDYPIMNGREFKPA